MKKITVLLAEDHTVVREGFRKILELDKDLEVVGEAQDGRQAAARVSELRPDVVLMDISMPLLNGLEATRQILKEFPATQVIILSAHSDDANVQSAVESGAVGFLVKQTSAQDVCRAVREVQNGKTVSSPCVSHRFNRLTPSSPGWTGLPRQKAAELTSREKQVLKLIAEGNANKEAASQLGIGLKTVEKHRAHLMRKLGLHETAGLTRYAVSAGIIESGRPLAHV
jgi:DNA-binding NarL/FixJ family response regulator